MLGYRDDAEHTEICGQMHLEGRKKKKKALSKLLGKKKDEKVIVVQSELLGQD